MHACGYTNETESTFTAKLMLLYITDGGDPSTSQEPGTVGSQSEVAPAALDLSAWMGCSGCMGLTCVHGSSSVCGIPEPVRTAVYAGR